MEINIPDIDWNILGTSIREEMKPLGFEISRIILFGSRARRDYHQESDYDILILLKHPVQEEDRLAIWDSLYAVELKLGIVMEVVIYSEQRWSELKVLPLHQNVTREGIIF